MKKTGVLLFVLLISSCTSMRYGNFTQLSQNRDAFLAKDAVSQLIRVYPPAKNTFCIGHKVDDNFGVNLVSLMRKKGYGVVENNCLKQNANFFYVVDTLQSTNLYRVGLYVGPQSLSRIYAKNGDKITPAGTWTHKE